MWFLGKEFVFESKKAQIDLFLKSFNLPESWRVVEGKEWSIVSSHDFVVIDDKGRFRATIVGLDRNPDNSVYPLPRFGYHICLLPRFTVVYDAREYKDRDAVFYTIRDGGKPIRVVRRIVVEGSRNLHHERAQYAVRVWLDKNYPNWRDPDAYWD